ncbi:syntaxin Ufe1p [[Candida] anglica]|uniref:Syntaxin Ufe1p n=1 Tax=[Candida] anglica TaxID=148631 RepID=A0ABP0EDQ3_9ASCO
MSDLTPLFQQCVSIVETSQLAGDSRKRKAARGDKENSSTKSSGFHIQDTFLKECLEYRVLLAQLDGFVTEVRPHYLEVHDQSSVVRGNNALSIEDKNKIDEDFQFKVQQLYEKLKVLQTYEQKRRQVEHSKKDKGMLSAIFGSEQDDDMELFWTTIAVHRTQILKSLNELTNGVGKKFEQLQRKRFKRERDLNLLNFQNLNEGVGDDLEVDMNTTSTSWKDYIDQEIQETEEDMPQETPGLSQQFLQELSQENSALLSLKETQLTQVEKLRTSMMDIVNLQTELSFQLEAQSEQIESLLDNQGQIEMDVRSGNQSLNKATSRNKTGSRIIITTSIVVAFLILFLDYIS